MHDIGENPDKKVGALNYGYALIANADYLLGVDGDTTLAPDAVEHLEAEIISDTRIGGISAIYSIDDTAIKAGRAVPDRRPARPVRRLQHAEHAPRPQHGRARRPVLDLLHPRSARRDEGQPPATPWVNDSEVEDSLLSLQIKSAGYLTKISAQARADVGGMTTLRALDGQQVKWNYGAIDLMWPGQRGDTKGQPFHPNLRLRWIENLGMITNIFTRVAFLLLLAASLSIHAFVFSPVWLIPPVVAILLNVRIA